MLKKNGDLVVRTAVFSVWDKTGMEEFAKFLRRRRVAIYATGGSKKAMDDVGITGIHSINELTKNENPDEFDHRMATISFNYESALLFDREKGAHVVRAKELGIPTVDLVVCNFYPFKDAIIKATHEGITGKELMKIGIEKIDIGGPCMVRAVAKNHRGLIIVTNPRQYQTIMSELNSRGCISYETRQKLASEAFALSFDYDKSIFEYLQKARRDHVPF